MRERGGQLRAGREGRRDEGIEAHLLADERKNDVVLRPVEGREGDESDLQRLLNMSAISLSKKQKLAYVKERRALRLTRSVAFTIATNGTRKACIGGREGQVRLGKIRGN